MNINEIQQKFASHCRTATGQTSDSERGGGGATPHGAFNQENSRRPRRGSGVSNILLLFRFALATAGPPLSLTPGNSKRLQNNSNKFLPQNQKIYENQ